MTDTLIYLAMLAVVIVLGPMGERLSIVHPTENVVPMAKQRT
jgi:hypothetical protein